jgi:hypothetical protein
MKVSAVMLWGLIFGLPVALLLTMPFFRAFVLWRMRKIEERMRRADPESYSMWKAAQLCKEIARRVERGES